ncbi:hypothetical protein [Arthrobacter pityocampae]|uniref:hypothetical protein n=1 Tax=Arthrobacter pityocampae TaxID=547334 RepID=UPI0037367CB5
MPAKTRNGVDFPVGSDPYNLTPDMKKAFESANLTIPVTNKAARDGLASQFPGNTLPVNQRVARGDIPGLIETWTGTRWISNAGAIHLELDFAAPINIANSPWGPGSPSQMTAGINQDASRNPSQFSFPSNNQVKFAIEGLYALSWAVTDFSRQAGGLILINKGANGGQILASKSIGVGSSDITAERPSAHLLAGQIVTFSFRTTEAVSCRHLLSITKIG